eukprot:s80_g21.t1
MLFSSDPVWAPEWRELLQKFDEQWGTAAAATASPSDQAEATPTKQEGGTEVKAEGGFDWGAIFPQEPTTLDKIKAKHGGENLIEIPALGNTSFLVGPGPCLYLMAKEAVILKQWEAPLIMHGAGVWLIGEKARKFSTNNPGKGQCDDKFEIKPDPENELLWRPNAIQTKSLKAANLASHFPYNVLNDSALVIAPWNPLRCLGETDLDDDSQIDKNLETPFTGSQPDKDLVTGCPREMTFFDYLEDTNGEGHDYPPVSNHDYPPVSNHGTLKRSLHADFSSVADDTQPKTKDLPEPTCPERVAGDSDTTVGDDVVEVKTPELEPEGGQPETESKPEGSEPVKKKVKKETKPKTEAQIMAHRRNSNNWHSKWLSKGVPRTEPKKVSKPKKSMKVKDESKGGKKGKSAPATASAAPATDGPGQAVLSLSKAKDDFVSDWISKSNLPPSNARRNAAVKAWLESDLRANLMAQRAGVQK